MAAQLVCFRVVVERISAGRRWVVFCVALGLFILPGVSAAQPPQRSHIAHHRAAPKAPKKPTQHVATAKPKKRAAKPRKHVAVAKHATYRKHHDTTTPSSRHLAGTKTAAAGTNSKQNADVPCADKPLPAAKTGAADSMTRAPQVPTVAHPTTPAQPTAPEVPAPKGYDAPSNAIPSK